jgi:hypothetical protein
MTARAAITELKPVVPGFDDVHKSTRRAAIGIVANCEDAIIRINTDAKWIPKARGHPREIPALFVAVENATFP